MISYIVQVVFIAGLYVALGLQERYYRKKISQLKDENQIEYHRGWEQGVLDGVSRRPSSQDLQG